MDSTFLLVFSCVLVILFGIQAVPLVVLALDSESIKSSFESPEATAAALHRSELLRKWLQPVQDLGFITLGVKAEKLPLWGPKFREIALVSTSADAYAGLVLHPDGSPSSLYFYTPIRDGGMVFTRNFPGQEQESARISVRNAVQLSVGAIFDDHRARVEQFRSRGLVPAVSTTQQGRLAATTAFYRSEYGRQSLPPLWSSPVRWFAAALVLLLAAVIWALAGSDIPFR